MNNSTATPTMRIVMIQPASYDEEGYVIQFWRVFNTNYTLSAIHGMLLGAAQTICPKETGRLEIRPIDESCEIIDRPALIQWMKGADRCLVMLVGVLSAHYPRSVDLAREFSAAHIRVIIGGFHVSACLSTTPDWSPCLEAARTVGASLFAGEMEGMEEDLLRDAWLGELKPFYSQLEQLPNLRGAPPPYLEKRLIDRMATPVAGIELGRGCPYKCSFCCIINVFGNKYRSRSAEELQDHLRHCCQSGVVRFTLVDDNLSRNPQWRILFEIMGKLREEEGLKLDFFMQIDARAHLLNGFVEGAKRAGCSRVFIGIESVRDVNLVDANKRTSPISELKKMALTWKKVGIMVYGGYIIGMPQDTPERVEEDIRTLQDEIAVDALHFSMLTPLPGSKDHQRLLENGAFLHPDFNCYDGIHALTPHPSMSKEVWEQLYIKSWKWLFSSRYIRRVFQRAILFKLPVNEIFGLQLLFSGSIPLEGISPLEGGIWRHKVRTDRRPSHSIETIWRFYPKRLREIITVQIGGWVWRFIRLKLLLLWARTELWLGLTGMDRAIILDPKEQKSDLS
ncbi:MAG: radical SAM protein [Magnetococcales bacterium]|nr:radical SAM protein [Magnetococcales bacterium]